MYPAIRLFAKSKNRPIDLARCTRGPRSHRSQSRPCDHPKGTSPAVALEETIPHVRPRRVRTRLGHVPGDASPNARGEPRADPRLQLLRRVRHLHGAPSGFVVEAGLPGAAAAPNGSDARARPRLLREKPVVDGWRAGTFGPRAPSRVPSEPPVSHPVVRAERSFRANRGAGARARTSGGPECGARGDAPEGRRSGPVSGEGLIPAPGFPEPMDYRALGLKVGLEIHQQLATRKLFCECESVLVEEPGGIRFRRRLRPTQSEMGEIDAAALEEAKRRLTFVYEATPNSCLVEADEEPPHPPNPEALDIALEIALLLDAEPVNEVDFMRKIVIDGSNTSGFQRSGLVALDGRLDVSGKRIGVPTILLEEDAARKLGEGEAEVVYRLDRLGIPLVEIATTPNIETPEEAREVALAFGSLLRATRKVKRGIGTIREDVNVSIEGGARIEIKGVQELRLIATFVEKEVERQVMLLEVATELKRRNITSVPTELRDLTSLFRETESKVVQTALKRGGVVLGWGLLGFAGLLKGKLGPELAAHARIAGVAGIFHSDELPGYGITQTELDAVRKTLGVGASDACVLVAEQESKARAAFDEMGARAAAAIRGVPPETREPRPDGTTAYSRPLPGKARMYPETDVPPIRITTERLRRIREHLPERPDVTIARLAREYGIHEQQTRQLVQEGSDAAFGMIAHEFGEAKLVASVLLYTFGELRREGFDVDGIPVDHLRELFSLLKTGRFAKEALPGLVREMARTHSRASDAMGAVGVTRVSRKDLESIVDEALRASEDLISSRGNAAEKALMGQVMERVRGRADGKLVSEVLHERLEAFGKQTAKGKKKKR